MLVILNPVTFSVRIGAPVKPWHLYDEMSSHLSSIPDVFQLDVLSIEGDFEVSKRYRTPPPLLPPRDLEDAAMSLNAEYRHRAPESRETIQTTSLR